MKKHNLVITAFVLITSLFSCQKSENKSISTIGFEKQYLAARGESSPICIQIRMARGSDIDPDPKVYLCYPKENICFIKMVWVPCRLGIEHHTIADNEINITIKNVENKLKINFDLEEISEETKIKFFHENLFIMDEDIFFPEELTKELGLETPYLIQKGEYPLIGNPESDKIVSVIL